MQLMPLMNLTRFHFPLLLTSDLVAYYDIHIAMNWLRVSERYCIAINPIIQEYLR
jgi:hypothetical protein